MSGKRGLIMGVANDRSIAWGIARACHEHGAELAFTYQGEALEKRVRPLATGIGSKIVVPCDVTDEASIDRTFETVKAEWGGLDFVVHAIAFSDKNELDGALSQYYPRELPAHDGHLRLQLHRGGAARRAVDE